MSLPSLNVSPGASPPIQHHPRGGHELSASQSGFGAIMQSLSDRGSRVKSSENLDKGAAASRAPFDQGNEAPGVRSVIDARAVDAAAVSIAPPPFAFPGPRAVEEPLLEQSVSAPGPTAAVSSAESSAATRLLSVIEGGPPYASSNGQVENPVLSLGAADHGRAGSDTRAFSAAAEALQLRVSRSVSHFGPSSPPSLAGTGPSKSASANGAVAAASLFDSGREAPAASSVAGARAVSLPAFASAAAQDGSSSATVSSAESDTATRLLSVIEGGPPYASSNGQVENPVLSLGAADHSRAGSDTRAFSAAAEALQLRVSRSVSHFGPSSPPSLVGAGPSKSASANGAVAAASLFDSGREAPAASSVAGAQAVSLPAFASAAAQDGSSSATVSRAESETATRLLSVIEGGAPYGASDRVRAGSDTRASSAAAEARQLRPSRPISALEDPSPSLSAGIGPSRDANVAVANILRRTTDVARESFHERTPPSPQSKENIPVGDTAAASGAGTMSSVISLPLPLLPDVIAEATASLEQPQLTARPNAAVPARDAPGAKIGAARELDVQLTPPELGSLFIKLKLSDGALSVVIEASKPAALSAIERERDTILSRITSAEHQVSSLILRASDPTQNTHENGDAYRPISENGSNAQGQTDQRPQWSEAGARKKNSGSENSTPSNSVGYLLI